MLKIQQNQQLTKRRRKSLIYNDFYFMRKIVFYAHKKVTKKCLTTAYICVE